MAKAADLVNATLDMLHLFRSDLEWEKHKYTTDIAASVYHHRLDHNVKDSYYKGLMML